MTGSQIAVCILAFGGASFLVGLGVGESGRARQENLDREAGLKVASTPAPRAEIKCGKQEIREYLNACSTQRRMEKVK